LYAFTTVLAHFSPSDGKVTRKDLACVNRIHAQLKEHGIEKLQVCFKVDAWKGVVFRCKRFELYFFTSIQACFRKIM